ncbi:MAG: V-type ATPase subunit [Planctomycetes bacterium]|nr:V-type ATPase subunit [Planctomycetota bacterium]
MNTLFALPKREIDPHAWCFLSGRICVLENDLLRRDSFERLLLLEGPKEILTSLKESPLRDDFLIPEDVLNFEEILQRRFFHLLQEVKELSPTLVVWELLQTRYDLINLKNFLKERLFGLSRPTPFPSPYTDETWEALIQNSEYRIQNTELFVWQTGMYLTAVKDLKGRLEKISENPGLVDLILDGAYLSCLPQLAERTASPFIINYSLEYQKLMGILFSWRASTKVSRGGVTPSLPGYEKMAEDTLMERLEAARLFVFGPERVFGYLKGLETETLNLRLAIGGRLQGIPPEDVHQRLRKGYV